MITSHVNGGEGVGRLKARLRRGVKPLGAVG